VGKSLFGPYALVVELASMLLLVALIGARHLAGHREPAERAMPSGIQTLTEADGRPHADGSAVGREAGEARVLPGGGEAMAP